MMWMRRSTYEDRLLREYTRGERAGYESAVCDIEVEIDGVPALAAHAERILRRLWDRAARWY